jgi:hypothetical protein
MCFCHFFRLCIFLLPLLLLPISRLYHRSSPRACVCVYFKSRILVILGRSTTLSAPPLSIRVSTCTSPVNWGKVPRCYRALLDTDETLSMIYENTFRISPECVSFDIKIGNNMSRGLKRYFSLCWSLLYELKSKRQLEWDMYGNYRGFCGCSINFSKTKIDLNYISRFGSYCAVNTSGVSVIKSHHLILCREIIAVCSEIHTKDINTSSLCPRLYKSW